MKELPPGQTLAAPHKWPLVGETQPRVSDEPWRVTVAGHVAQPRTWSLEEIRQMPQVEQTVDIHCVTHWSKPGARFTGVPLRRLLEVCSPLPDTRYLSFVSRSERDHSTSLPLATALELGALVALTYEGEPLPTEHGGPIRMVMPGRYFYKSVKWLERIELRTEDRLGYWEDAIGYHNDADPWQEQRFDERRLPEQADLEKGFQSQDFSGLILLNLDARGRRFQRLKARNAQFRNAKFCRVSMPGACFEQANLSGSHLQGADLRKASFVGADVEGVDFRGADLRGANLTGAFLAGVRFCPEGPVTDDFGPARMDATTRMDPDAFESLTSPVQQAYVREALGGEPRR